VSKMGNHYHRFRLILDCVLVLAVILAIFTYRQPRQANAEPLAQPQELSASSTQEIQQQTVGTATLTETEQSDSSIILANETIAAVIAAENAVLTPPLYMADLPVITH
jgi:hypothetical protein